MIRYVIPSDLLFDTALQLQPPEKVCFVSGLKLFDVLGGRIIVLHRIIPVDCNASRTHAAPDPAAVLRIHQTLLNMGLDIEGQFHSHPGRSLEATHPSSTDLHTARRWENGAPFLGGIFSEGGRFVRFFGHQQQSEVIVYGKGITLLAPNCFELSQVSSHPLPSEAGDSRRLVLDRSPGAVPLVGSEENQQSPNTSGWLRRLGL